MTTRHLPQEFSPPHSDLIPIPACLAASDMVTPHSARVFLPSGSKRIVAFMISTKLKRNVDLINIRRYCLAAALILIFWFLKAVCDTMIRSFLVLLKFFVAAAQNLLFCQHGICKQSLSLCTLAKVGANSCTDSVHHRRCFP